MKRFLACVSLVAVATTATSSASTTPAAKPAAPSVQRTPVARIKVAPADEYFGKLKMSILGIRNTIKDVGANIDADPGRWSGLVNKADFTEDALRDWERKYPADTWLAKTVFALERMYAKLDSEDGRKRSLAAMNWLVRDFPASYYGRLAKKEIASGHVGHPPGAGKPNSEATLTDMQGPGGPTGPSAPNPVSSTTPARAEKAGE
ncbi:MAG: hypothetical protein NVSMB64_14720 [Candidatus Velthaea sp.]